MYKAVIAAVAFTSSVEAHKTVFSKHHELDGYDFDTYKRESGKKYSTAVEESKRKEIFYENLKRIQIHNSEDHSWKKGVNQFTDMTAEEVKGQSLGGDKNALYSNSKKSKSLGDSLKTTDQLPASVDWRNTPNVISAVKDQVCVCV